MRIIFILLVLSGLFLHAADEPSALPMHVIFVYGSVKNPGRVLLPENGTSTIKDAIRLAGGTTIVANLSLVRLQRKQASGKTVSTVVDMTSDKDGPIIQAGDIIFVAEREL
jgi:protein involved in polysaccharide export with SLBB domain